MSESSRRNEDDRDGSGIFSIMGTMSQISNSLVENFGNIDKISQTVNSISKHSKGTIFGVLGVVVSDNSAATAIGWGAGIVAGGVVSVAGVNPLAGLVIGYGVADVVERMVRASGTGSGSNPPSNPESPSQPSSNMPGSGSVNPNGDHPNPADQASGYNHHNTPSGGGSGSSDNGEEQDTAQGPNLDGDHPNPADQAFGYNQHNTPSGGGSGSSDNGEEQDTAQGPNLDGDHPNPADQAFGYNQHNAPSGGGSGSSDSGNQGEGGDGGDGGSGGGGGGKPVVLDLDGDGVELVALEDSTAFYDIRGDGFRYHLSWVAPDDGLLAYDRDGDGRISERGEISFVDYVDGARTDLEGLRHFDTNGDNVLDSADGEWSKFRVWRDLDQDGESDPGELRSLDDAGIRSISLVSSGEVETRADGTQVLGRGTYVGTVGGAPVTRELQDVAFAVAPWGFRTTEAGVEVRWGQGEEAVDGFIATSDAPVTLDVAAGGHSSAMGGAGDDRLTNSGGRTSMLAGLAGDDELRGGTAGDLLLGGDGDDALYGGAGTDILDGGPGADRVDGGTGDDLVHGGAGSDTLDGGAGRDTVSYETSGAGVTVDLRDADGDGYHDTASGGHAAGDRIRNFEHVVGSAHADRLTGDGGANRLEGGAGRDELYGGAGDDVLAAGSNATGGWQVLSGESGNDTYRIGSTDGQVRIDSAAEGAGTGGSDRVVFTDLSLSEVEFTHHGSPPAGATNPVEGVALVIRWTKAGESGEVHIAEMGRHIERFEFADGSVLGGVEANWRARYDPTMYPGDPQDRLVGTAHDDIIVSGSSPDRLDGGAGNDHLDGGSSRDELYGEDGDDTLTGGEGNDVLTGGDGADELHGGAGDDELRGGAGDDVLVGGAGVDQWLRGEDGDDTLDAGASDGSGRQRLDGGAGNDTYRVGKGDGLVVVVSWAEGADTGTADRVVFTDLALADVSFVMETWRLPALTEDGELMWGDDGELVWEDEHTLVVEWTKDGESGRLEIADGGEHIERYEFADGSVVSRIEAQRLVGTSGADRIATGSGDERIDGGGGDDTLSGGAGDDTYEFTGRAFGSDRVSDSGGEDRIEFTSDVGWDQLWFSRTGDDLLIELMGTDSEVTVEGWWSGALVTDVDAARQVETIQAGEYALTASAVQQLVQAMAGMAGPASGQTTLDAVQRAQMAAPLAAWQELTGS